MTKGIPEFSNEAFAQRIPMIKPEGGTAFRKAVMASIIESFPGTTVASAATHYNHSKKMAMIDSPKAIEGLGRAEDKKGGRKPLTVVDVIKVKDGTVVATGISRGAAQHMITAAKAKRKSALAIKGDDKPAETPVATTPAVDNAAAGAPSDATPAAVNEAVPA